MNAFITLTVVACAIVLAIAIKKKVNKRKPRDNYNDFHLGEMTKHDVPARFAKREQEYTKWSGRQTKKTEDAPKSPDKGGTKLWNKK